VTGASHPRAIRLRLRGSGLSGLSPAAVYRVAGCWLLADRPLAELEPFAVDASPRATDPGRPTDWRSRRVERSVYCGFGLVAGAVREVECRRLAQGWEVVIPDVCRLGVSVGGAEVAVLDESDGLSPSALAEAVLGPGLILALALHGVYCLHASAVSTRRGAIAFLGESGRGKSTLARFLATEAGLGWTPVADDILPVEPTADGLDVLPRFPQLKLPAAEQYPADAPERLPLCTAFALAPDRTGDRVDVAVERLAPLPASLALLRHTAAARLFDRNLAAGHLEACGRAAGRLPLCDLRYPFTFAVFPSIARALASKLGPEPEAP